MDGNWSLSETAFDPCRMRAKETLFNIGNGVYCTRGAFEESYPGETPATFASGLYDDTPTYQTELVNLPNWLWLQVWAGDEPFRMDRGTVLSYVRTLDIYGGCLKRRVVWRSPGGGTLELVWERWISLADAHAMGIRMRITSQDYRGKIEIRGGLDGWVDNAGVRHWDLNRQGHIDRGGGYLHLQTKNTNLAVCQAFVMKVEGRGCASIARDDAPWTPGVRAVMSVDAGQTVSVEKLVALFCEHNIPEADKNSPGFDLVETTLVHLQQMEHRGYEALLRESQADWAKEWEECAVTIEGDPEIELAVRFNLYHLLIAAPRNLAYGGMSARGLSGFGYHGHIFWDAEIYMLPFLSYTRPQLARHMLLYRYHTLTGARANAREKGWRGSMFAWESAATGEEATPRWVPEKNGVELERIWSGDLSVFTTAVVAWAAYQYWQIAGDDAFMEDYGAEIILDTARFWESRAEWDAENGCYEFNDVIGPDEFHLHVDNNAFTNHLARWNLETAQEIWDWLRQKSHQKAESVISSLELAEPDFRRWAEISENIAIHFDMETGLIEQYDGYFDLEEVNLADYEPRLQSIQVILGIQRSQNKLQITRQPDVLLLLYLVGDLLDRQKIEYNYQYYLPKTDLSHGSSLGNSIVAALAARLGQAQEAYRYLRDALRVDLADTFGNTRDGFHTGNAGGIWQALALGFAGLQVSTGGEYTLQPCLPPHWRRVAFSIYLRGKRYAIEIRNARKDQEIPADAPIHHLEKAALCSTPWADETQPDHERADIDLLLDSLPGMHYLGLVDGQRTMLEVNTYCYNLTGLHPAELIQEHHYIDLIHPQDREYVVKELEKVKETNKSYYLIYRMITNAGREKWVWESGRVLPGHGTDSPQSIEGRIIELTGRNTEFIALSNYAERVECLREIDQAILVAQSSSEVIHTALRALRRQAPSIRINLVLFNLEENQAELFNVMDRSQEVSGMAIQVTPEVRRWWYSFGLASSRGKTFITQDDLELCLDPQIADFVDKFGIYNHLIRLEYQGALLGILALGSDRPTPLAQALLSMANEVANLISIALTQRRLLEQLHSVNQNLQNLSRRLVDLQEQERRYLARELHDEIGQSLTAIKINLESMSNLPPGADRKRLDDCIQVVSQTLQQVRNISLDLRPALLDELGLAATMRWYVERLAQWNEIKAQFKESLRQERLPVEIETTLFRVAQEALTNVIRHAGAKRVNVTLNQTRDVIRLQVRDDGHGFHVADALQAVKMGNTLGLLSIQERLHLIGGRLEIHSTPGMGSVVSAEIPFSDDERDGIKGT